MHHPARTPGDARRDRRIEEVAPDDHLHLQQRVLDVVPELDPERHHPPPPGTRYEARAQDPEPDEHDEGVRIVQPLGGYP